ncbi:hypothetical protein H6503_03705 [Candidatus Woesearchaeota archaeon]|nr:hypothetical protein [Candidatus Woesearchaeota archaeon]
MLSRKSEVNQIFIFLIAIVVIGVILTIGIVSVVNLMSNIEDVEMAKFAEDLQQDIKQASVKKGSTINEYRLPSKIGSMVFLDKTNKKALLNNQFVQERPIISDSIESGEKMNLFLFSKSGNLLKSYYVGEIGVGQFGDQVCTGVGFLNSSFGKVSIRMTNKPGIGMVLGEECTGLNYIAFQGPFTNDMLPTSEGVPHIAITSNKQALVLAEDIIRTTPEQPIYFDNGSINSSIMPIDAVDRIFFSASADDDSEIRYKVGFRETSGYWHFFGPNVTDAESYYSYSGQKVTEPSWAYDAAMIEISMHSNYQHTVSPQVNWVKLSYFE